MENNNLIECKICGKFYKSLQTHIKTHNISSSEYKELYKSPLFCEETINKNRKSVKKAVESQTPEERSLRGIKAAETRKINGTNRGGRKKGFSHTEEWKESHRQLMLQNNPFLGKVHSDETKEKMSLNHADFRGEKNPFRKSLLENPKKRKEHKLRCSNLWKIRKSNIEYMRNWRIKCSQRMASSSFFKDCKYHKYHKCGFLETKKAGNIFVRSSWEKEVALQLDENESVVSFTIENHLIEYLNNMNEIRYSRLDFLVEVFNGNKILIEVKPKPLQIYGNNVYKIIGYQNFCKKTNYQFSLFDLISDQNINNIIEKTIKGELYVT